METLVLAVVVLQALMLVMMIVVLFYLLGMARRDVSGRLDASLQEKFLSFQSNIQQQLGDTRRELVQSKDLLSQHTLRTMEIIQDMGATVQKIIREQEETRKLGESLKDVLQAPKLRGSYGEAVLEEMLEQALPRGLWERQYAVGDRERVDAVVKFKNVVIPIDAKFPRADYQRYMDAAPEARSGAWKDYENAVRVQIRSIASKYIRPEAGTSEFALMFIPSEAVYYETIAEKNYLGEPSGLYEFARESRVVPVSPNTLYAFLQIIILGVRNVEIVKNVQKLQKGLVALRKSFDHFYKRYEEMGKQIEKASESYRLGDKHIDLYRRHLESALRLESVPGEEDEVEIGEGPATGMTDTH
jgi:DNA recombination protein RmuC